jgi:GT2 family glycosyltransferase
MPAASIIITNWNGKKWLADCFKALYAQTSSDFEIILVDDGSTDGSAEWVNETFPSVRVIRQQEHLGFAGANNVGIRAAQGEFIVTLNNDTLADPNWLEAMMAAVTVPDVGMVAAQMLIWDNPDLLDSAGIEVDWAGFGWNRMHGLPAQRAMHQKEIFGPCAGAALYRRDMLAEIGLFDEDFYTYYEDIDLAWRAHRAGWRCVYTPAAKVLHYHSATGGRYSTRKVFLLSRNRLWSIVKNFGRWDFLWAWPLLAFYDVLSLVYQLWRTRSLSPIRGRWQAVTGIGKMIRKRTRSQRRARLVAPLSSLPK